MPRALCRKVGRISSSKVEPQIEMLDLGDVEGAPVCAMKVGIRRWKGEEL